MKKTIVALATLLFASASHASQDNLYISLKTGGLRVIPAEIIVSQTQSDGQLRITLQDGTERTYDIEEIESIGNQPPQELPRFVSYKFNNKYNDQVFTDVEGLISDDGNSITATVGGIGKRLTPSFKLDSEDAVVYIGREQQHSKVSRRRFDQPVTYTVGLSDWKRLDYMKLSDEVWSEAIPEEVEREAVELDADRMWTNASANHGGEGLEAMLDGDTWSFFHSTWGSSNDLPLDEWPYIDMELEEPLKSFSFYYVTRSDCGQRDPQAWRIYGSADGDDWKLLRTLDEEDGVPQTGLGATYQSPTIKSSEPVNYLRFEMTRAEYKNYLCLAEFALFKDLGVKPGQEAELQLSAVYGYTWQPYGREVTVSVEWLTDHATQVPRIDITTDCGRRPYDKTTWLTGYITIDGAGVFPDLADSVRIRGRGNSSWQGEWGKSPYRLKFAKKVKPFGLTKGKNWVLQANAQSNSMLANASAMKIAQRIGTVGANHVVPVELYLNGDYCGSYIFNEQVGLANNSVALEDETNAVRLELDTYWDDWQFSDDHYGVSTVVKDPDLFDLENGNEMYDFIRSQWNKFTGTLANGTDDYVRLLDPEMLARYLAVNEIVANCELFHPKSTFLYTEDIYSDEVPWVFGPVWDFDWAYGYQQNHTYGINAADLDFFNYPGGNGRPFFRDLRYNSEEVRRCSYKIYKQFMENDFDEMQDFLDDYLAYAQPSFRHNAERWGDGNGYDQVCNNMKRWLAKRSKLIYDNIETFDLGDEDPKPDLLVGDANSDGYITMADVVLIIDYILGREPSDFSLLRADVDQSGLITINDAVRTINLVLQQPALRVRHYSLPEADASLRAYNIEAQAGEETELPVSLRIAEGSYTAAQFDITLPSGFTLEVVALERAHGFSATYAALPEGGYRVAFYNAGGAALPLGETAIRLFVRASAAAEAGEQIASLTGMTLVTAEGDEERLPATSARIRVTPSTGILQLAGAEHQSGTFALDGRQMSNTSALPRGIYIVNGKKIVK